MGPITVLFTTEFLYTFIHTFRMEFIKIIILTIAFNDYFQGIRELWRH